MNSTFRHLTYGANNAVGSVAYLYVQGEAAPLEACADPVFVPNGGVFTGSTEVTITSTEGATIYFTTDGTDPVVNRSSIASGGTVTLTESCTLKAMAVKSGMENSAIVTSQSYTITSGSGSNSKIYRKVTSANDLEAGKKYIIMYENGSSSVGMGAFETGTSPKHFTAVSGLAVSDNKVDITNKDVLEMTLGGSSGAWTLYTGTGYIQGNDAVSFSIVSNVTNSAKWEITNSADDADGFVVHNTVNTARYIRYYNSGSGSFRHYNTNNGVWAYLYVQSNVPTITAAPNPLEIEDTNEANGKTGTILVSGENLNTDNVGIDIINNTDNFSRNPTYFSQNGSFTNHPVEITYTGKALHATGSVRAANDQTNASVNVDYLYVGPIYVVGDVNGTYWNADNAPQMTRGEDGIYTLDVTVQQSDGTAGYITFSKQSGSNYSNYRFGPISSGNWWLDGNENVYQDIDTVNNTVNNIRILPGSYTIYVDSKNNQFKISPYVIDITISPEDGTHFTGSSISGTITSNHADATIEWSTDGTNWQSYSDGFTAEVATPGQSVTVYARATGNGVTSTAQATYTRDYAPAPNAPNFSIGSGDVARGTVITITAPEGCTLYVDGQQVNSPYEVTINHSTSITAYCVNSEGTPSETVTNTYTIASVCSASIVFSGLGEGHTGDSQNALGEITNDCIESGGDLISSSTASAIYIGRLDYGLKLGSSGSTGSFTINLPSQAEGWQVTKIIVNAQGWSANAGGELHVTTSANAQGSTQELDYSSFGNYEFVFDGSNITSFTVSTTSDHTRCWVKSVTLVYSCGSNVDAPVITPATGTYYENQTVTITAEEGCKIYYTTNGTTPTTSSPVYTGEFTAAYTAGSTTTIKAMAVDQDDNESEVTTVVYTWGTPAVTIHPDSRNTLATSINVTLTSEPAGGTIYYTTDGSTPSAENGTPYTGGFTVNIPNVGDAVTVKAITVVNGMTSPVATATYTHVAEVLDVHAPFFSPLQNNTYYGDQTLQIATTTPNADIYYEIVEVSGNTAPSASAVEDPTHMSNHYDGTPIEMTPGHSYYVKAIAYVGNYVSDITGGYYIIEEFNHNPSVDHVYQNLKDFNDNCPTGVTARFANPVQVVYHSTYTNDGTMAEFCYVRDNTDYACVYFGKCDTHNYHIFKMGDWIDGSQIAGVTNIWENNFHIQLGTSHHEVTSWPSTTLGWSEILPEEITNDVIIAGTSDSDNVWGHYVHLRNTTLSDVHDADSDDPKHTGYITDKTATANYYDKFYRWSAGTCTYQNEDYTIHALGDYDQAFFTAKQNAGATFDVYGIVDYYSPYTPPFQICPIDFLWIYQPEISLPSGTYTSEQTVIITADHPEWAAEGTVIYYKTDDMEDWAIYTEPLTVNSDTHLQVYAEVPSHKSGEYGGANYNDYVRSEIIEATYSFEGVEDPIITPESEVIEVVDGTESETVTVQTNPNSGTGTVTLYTTDGSDPRTSETAIVLTGENGTFTVTETTTVNAVSYLTSGDNTIWSNVVTETYEFITPNDKTYDLLTSNPVVGNIYVIVNKAAKVGLSTTQNATNRAGIGVTFTDDTKTVVNGNNSLAEFILESANAGRYYFRQVGTQNYLCVTTNDNANLMTGEAGINAEASATVNSSVTSGVDESYPATITFSYDGTPRYMRYYANGRAFSTYTSATVNEDVFLYGIAAPELLPPTIDPKGQTVPDGTIINGTVTPDEENPEGAITWYTTDGSDPRTSSTRIQWTEDNNGAFNNIMDDATVKAVTGYEFGDGYVYSDVVSETYHFVFATTLAWIESEGELNTEYIVANELIGTWAVVDGSTKLLWAKDQGNVSIDKRPGKTDGQADYVKDILKYKRILNDEVQQNWDESNWVILDFSGIDDDPFEFVGHKISANSVKGEYSDNRNYKITLTDSPDLLNDDSYTKDVPEYTGYEGPFPEEKLGTNYDLAYNSYVPANFMTENHNHMVEDQVVGFVADNGALPGCQGDSLYFVNPKIQEVAHLWAVWNGGDEDIFTVYETEQKELDNGKKENINAWHLNGTFRVNWAYNCTGTDPNNASVLVYDRPNNLVPNMAYEFHAVIMRPENKGTRLTVAPQGTAEPGTPSQDYMVYPLDMSNDGTPTAVIELNAMKTVVSVTYYNLMGVESRKPFEGINIMVTRYSDGSIMTQKVLR